MSKQKKNRKNKTARPKGNLTTRFTVDEISRAFSEKFGVDDISVGVMVSPAIIDIAFQTDLPDALCDVISFDRQIACHTQDGNFAISTSSHIAGAGRGRGGFTHITVGGRIPLHVTAEELAQVAQLATIAHLNTLAQRFPNAPAAESSKAAPRNYGELREAIASDPVLQAALEKVAARPASWQARIQQKLLKTAQDGRPFPNVYDSTERDAALAFYLYCRNDSLN